jgi:hypothetical protein
VTPWSPEVGSVRAPTAIKRGRRREGRRSRGPLRQPVAIKPGTGGLTTGYPARAPTGRIGILWICHAVTEPKLGRHQNHIFAILTFHQRNPPSHRKLARPHAREFQRCEPLQAIDPSIIQPLTSAPSDPTRHYPQTYRHIPVPYKPHPHPPWLHMVALQPRSTAIAPRHHHIPPDPPTDSKM